LIDLLCSALKAILKNRSAEAVAVLWNDARPEAIFAGERLQAITGSSQACLWGIKLVFNLS
jgi:hypothetical protein